VLTKTGVVKLRLVGAFVYAGESLIAVAVVLYCTWSDFGAGVAAPPSRHCSPS
jgi:hypothetical protein